jgi:hypothetical protein
MAEKELEDIFGGDETNLDRCKRLLDENAPFAVLEVIDLMKNSTSDTVRLRSAQTILDRTLGPVGKDDQESALDAFIKGMSDLANGKSA